MKIELYTAAEINALIHADKELEKTILGEEFPEFARETVSLDALDDDDEI